MFSETSGDVGIVHRRTMVFVPARFRYFAVFPRFSLSFFYGADSGWSLWYYCYCCIVIVIINIIITIMVLL